MKMLLLILSLIICLSVHDVTAEPPVIANLSLHQSPTSSNTLLLIQMYYRGSGEYGDFLDKYEVNISGVVSSIPLPEIDPVYYTQTVDTYFDLGQVEGTPTIQVRAHSSVDGWGDWSSPMVVPEFPTPQIILIILIATTLAVSRRLGTKPRNS